MKRLLVSGAIVALLAACNSQTDEAAPATPAASEPATASAMTAAAEASADAGAASGVALAGLKKGDILIATKDTQCRETGANAGEPPWDVAVGSFAKFVATEGADVRVELAGDECLIPADAVKLSAS